MTEPRNAAKSRSGWSASRRGALETLFPTIPFPKHLGMKLENLGDGTSEISFVATSELRQYQGITHGGALSALADSAATFAAMTMLPDGVDVITIEFKVNFLAAHKAGTATASGRVVRMGRRVTVADVEIRGETPDHLLLSGTFTMLNFPIPGHSSSETNGQ